MVITFFIVPLVYYFFKGKNSKSHKKNAKLSILVLLLVLYKSVMHILANPNINIETYGGVYGAVSNLFQIIVWAAIMEELLFRLYLYDLGKNIFGSRGSTFISALLFTLFHFNVIEKCFLLNTNDINNLIAIFFLGLLLSVLYEHTNSIIICIIFHAIIDGLVVYSYLLINYYFG